MTRTLHQRIFRLVVGLVIVTSVTILVNVWTTITDHAKNQLEQDLQVAQSVLKEVLSNREAQLINSAEVLTADFGFKQAVASNDVGTIDSVLLNHGERIKADLMALISLNGQNITSVPAVIEPGGMFSYPGLLNEVLSRGGASSIIVQDDRLYQVILLTVDAPAPIAIALVGFELNAQVTGQLKNITQVDTAIRVIQQNKQQLISSTLPAEREAEILSSIDQEVNWFDWMFTDGGNLISQQFSVIKLDALEIDIVLSEDVSRIFDEFTVLQTNISLIALVAILMALIFAALLSRNVARPVSQMARVARSISAGDYQQVIETRHNAREINDLAGAFKTMQASIRDREREITFQAQHDILTGLFNRYHVGSILDAKYAIGDVFQSIGINIFGFRGINDVFGYHHGDECLIQLARRVEVLGGLSARLTGGELLWVPSQPVTDEQLKEIKARLEVPVVVEGVTISFKVALGVLMCPQDADSSESLFKRMNIVLDEAQISRRLTLKYQPELEQKYVRRLSIITALKAALSDKQEELSLCYQPKLNLAKGKVESAEALIRWNSQELGFVSPEEFINIAEQAGFIDKITEWVLNQSLTDIAKFRHQGVDISVAVNLSAHDVMNASLLSRIRQQLEFHHLPSSVLSFEITESDLVKEPEKAIVQLQALRDEGFSLAIDDFGTGYSSMAYLKSLPVDVLKIDKSFVLKLDSQKSDQNIVNTIIKLAENFELSVVAEGIESDASLSMLKAWGCGWAQGYHICKPIPADQVVTWIKQNDSTVWG